MILHGWKDIAKYLRCGVRTVQRWEKLGMPVRRPSGHASVVAISEEIDVWLRHGSPATADSTTAQATTDRSRRFRYRVLLADADEALLVTVAARLADEGYEVRTARDGFEALAAMREATPDILISELRMPNMSGFELLSIIRKRFPSMAVIACSREFATVGNPQLLCDQYVGKSVNSVPKLMKAVRELLSQSPLRTQPAKIALAPAWLPRSINGYFVQTCPDCLRSFSVMTRNAPIGEDSFAPCAHCGTDVKYYLEEAVLPIKEDLLELARYRDKGIPSGHAVARGTKGHRSTPSRRRTS